MRPNMNQFRKLALSKIAASAGISSIIRPDSEAVKPNILKAAGILTGLVEQYYGVKPFKEKFLALAAGPEREKLVYDEVTKRKPINMVPITVSGPGGTKITYKVMPDYITIDGLRVPMSARTAQKIADYFKMKLPTAKMSKQIWDAADVKIRPTPLSSSGFTSKTTNKRYSAEDVVKHKINDSDAAVHYSELIQAEIDKYKNKGKPNLIAGHMKDLIAPVGDPNKTGYIGWYDPKTGKPIEQTGRTGHGIDHWGEYGAGTRLISSDVVVTMPNGNKVPKKIDDILNSEMFGLLSDTRGVTKYNIN